MVIPTSEYSEESYWHTDSLGNKKASGYSDYFEIPTIKVTEEILNPNDPKVVDSRVEKTLLRQRAEKMNALNPTWTGKKILEIGGAFGHFAKELTDLGLDVTVVDSSSYCNTNKVISPTKYIAQDVITYLQSKANNSFDFIYSIDTLVCFTDAELTTLITQMNRVCRTRQIHVINPDTNPTYYNQKTMQQWLALAFENGTWLMTIYDFNNFTYQNRLVK